MFIEVLVGGNMKYLIFVSFIIFGTTTLHAAIFPPYGVYNKFASMFEGDKCFSVQEVIPPKNKDDLFLIKVNVCSEDRANAWQLLKADFKNARTVVQFYHNGKLSPKAEVTGSSLQERTDSLVKLIESALSGNPYFYRVLNTDCSDKPFCFYPHAITLEIEPLVIQTFVDNIHELHGNQNLTAAFHLSKLMVDKVDSLTISVTTRKK